MKPAIALTPGEPSGIGPDICLRVLTENHLPVQPVVIADPELLARRAEMLGIDARLLIIDPHLEIPLTEPGEIAVLPVSLGTASRPGKPDPLNADYVLQTLGLASKLCLDQTFNALVTGPVQKSIINEAGIAFTGHTEFLAKACHCKQVVMMLATTGLRVALATTHLPLREVPDAISRENLHLTLTILNQDLKDKFGIANPVILVAGLNPHAGEGGHLGREEIEIISPVLEDFRARGFDVRGPLPADTLFTPRYLDHCDAVLCMYHDQGLPVLKYAGFGKAVNITLGLPFIRTSVDHGTALDLAGTGKADPGSMLTAIDYAATMLNARS